VPGFNSRNEDEGSMSSATAGGTKKRNYLDLSQLSGSGAGSEVKANKRASRQISNDVDEGDNPDGYTKEKHE
jgi:hypothetical protein